MSTPAEQVTTQQVTTQQVTTQQVAIEQAVVDRLYGRLDTLRTRASDALARLRRSPISNTPAGRAERDAFDALHTERLATLRAVEDRLCFGRLDLSDGAVRYIGRLGMSDDDQHQLLVDWRAPAASSFYQATAASPDGVARRRHIATKGRTVSGVDDELLDDTGLDDDALTTVTGEGALLGALTARRTGRMRDIVATLQAEQDAIVRSPLSGVLVVQGGPGTGKTVVALHRAAYLLYTYRERIARSGVLVVGPSPVFLRYIEQVLPALGETGVLLSTPGQLFPGVDATAYEPDEVVAVKGDLRMARVVRNAVRDRQLLLDAPVRLSLDGDQLTLRPRVVTDARNRARQTGRPHNEARTTFVRHLLDDLTGQLARARKIDPDEETRGELQVELRESLDVRREINLLWMPQTATGFLGRLLSSPARLRSAAQGLLKPAEIDLLIRPSGSPWTPADVPLLDEAAELIGADAASGQADARARATAAAERREALEHAGRVLDNAGEANQMITAEALADRFVGGVTAATVAERARDDRTWTFGHVVLDEAQEASPMLWRLLARRTPSRSMTVVGDLAQTGSAAGASSWEEMLDDIAPGRWSLQELSVNYRTPGLIIRPATEMLRDAGISVRPAQAAREGDFAPRIERLTAGDPGAYTAAVVRSLQQDEQAVAGGRFAVIGPRALVTPAATDLAVDVLAGLDDELARRVSILTTDQAKGLEFDTVCVLEPAAILGESPRGINDLYVALTRPTQRLTVLHTRPLPPGLT